MSNKLSIRPSKDLRTNYAQISKLCRLNPVAITVNGKEDIVCMTHEDYMNQVEQLNQFRFEMQLIQSIKESEHANNDRLYTLDEVLDELTKRISSIIGK